MTKWKLVPVEPDDEQCESGHRTAWRSVPSLFDESDAANVYRAMLEAAPPPPKLSDERIDQICDSVDQEVVIYSRSGIFALARAIEREILGCGE